MKLLKQGDRVLYETVGVCQVKNVSTLDFLKQDRLYYSICPVFQKDTVIYVPVDNEKVKMRPVMSKEEAEEFISELPQIEGIQAENDKERFQMYKQMLFSGDRREWAAMIKGLRTLQKKRMEKGARLAVRDQEGMRTAQKLLHEELAAALEILPEQVPAYIQEKLYALGESLQN